MRNRIKALLAFVAVLVSVVAVSGAAYAAKNTSTTRPGWGYGDKNHVHTGPPGQSTRPDKDKADKKAEKQADKQDKKDEKSKKS